MAKLNVRNIRPITKSSHFNCRENDDVAFKFNFAAQLAFLLDMTSLFVGWSKHKKCARRRRVFSSAPGFSPCKLWQVLVYLSKYLIFLHISSLTSMKKFKNSLELPNPTRNTRKFANKLMTHTSGKINSLSIQDITCHLAKVKPATSAHHVTDVIPFLAYMIFPSNPTLR